MKPTLVTPEIVNLEFSDAVEAAVMNRTLQGELKGETRRQFSQDISRACEDPDHKIEVQVPLGRLNGPIVRDIIRRASKFGSRSVIDYDAEPIDYNPTNTKHVEHRVEAYLLGCARDLLEVFLASHQDQPPSSNP